MKVLPIVLLMSISAFCWSYNGGGNMVAFEKADAMYREGAFDLPADDYHGGMIGKFYMVGDKPALSLGHASDTKEEDRDLSFDGVPVNVSVNKPHLGSIWTALWHGSWGQYDLRVREWELTVTNSELPHSKTVTTALQKAVFSRWGNYYNDAQFHAEFRGIFQNQAAIADGSLTASKRDQVLEEAFDNIAYWSAKDDWGWEAVNMVNYNGEWEFLGGWFPVYYSYFRGLYDIDDIRCDFMTEWAYEKNAIPVWGADANLKWISGGGTEHADYHNDALDNNNGYTLDELSPLIQSGDFTGNDRNAQSRTTFRPSVVVPPTIDYFWPSPSGIKFRVSENASKYVYYSILLYNSAGAFVRYAKDDQGTEYRYRQLYLSQDNGKTRSQIFYPTRHSGDDWSAYAVKLVVTDEGANTSELNYAPTYEDMPQTKYIHAVVPNMGIAPSAHRVGDKVNVYCRNFFASNPTCHFSTALSENLFYFNGVQATAIKSSWDQEGGTYIQVAIPPGATSGPLTFVINGGQSNKLDFLILPTIESITPKSALPGETITLHGHDFPANTSGIAFYTEANVGNAGTNKVMASSFTRVDATTVCVVVPNGAFRGVGLSGNLASGATYFAPLMDFLVRPKIISVPAISRRGKQISIQGENFSLTPEVWFGTQQASVQSASPTLIVATIPNFAPYGKHFLTVKSKHSHCKYFDYPDDVSGCGVRPNMETVSNAAEIDIRPNLSAILSLLLN